MYDQRTAVSGTIEISRQMYNARLFCGTNYLALNRSGKHGTKISWSSMKQKPLDVGSGSLTARKPWWETDISSQCQIVKKRTKYILSPNFVEMATLLACNASAKLPIFHYSLKKACLSPCSRRGVLARQK